MSDIVQDMFDLSFYGYGTRDLARLAKISDTDAILFQSGSPKVNSKSKKAMTQLIKKLQEKHHIS